ncbi:MAG: hypothetical protein Q8Q31_05925 [Nanoarchaeota archaeon]|nr:hypothetical protein [Nanoarchaeota archaeon]
MAKAETGNLIGSWAFLIGVVLAVVLGAFGDITQGVLITLVIIGLIVGLLNVADKEVTPFLLSGAVLIIAASFGQEQMSAVRAFGSILQALLAIFVPATVIVAIKNVFSLARH